MDGARGIVVHQTDVSAVDLLVESPESLGFFGTSLLVHRISIAWHVPRLEPPGSRTVSPREAVLLLVLGRLGGFADGQAEAVKAAIPFARPEVLEQMRGEFEGAAHLLTRAERAAFEAALEGGRCEPAPAPPALRIDETGVCRDEELYSPLELAMMYRRAPLARWLARRVSAALAEDAVRFAMLIGSLECARAVVDAEGVVVSRDCRERLGGLERWSALRIAWISVVVRTRRAAPAKA